ncbi:MULTISPECIES: DUF1304 domain-containing protein [Rodentibacter]|uniref:DUF1304 domain-containing protein n=1 Tax=Rodentibacter TaxID=1960084 RepID=UPI001CFC86CB|nr:DUF1304 domain-containing protein [Rodentibacter sp. JRC1]GJI55686.1 membrane protein [Rodentibacter sp. JRC1]
MEILASILTALVALEHFYILYLEMFALNSPVARRIFKLTEQDLANPKIKVLFANQGLYNGFLAAGLVFSLSVQQVALTYFFLICVIIAAIYGAITANKGILFKQGLPAVLAFAAYFL